MHIEYLKEGFDQRIASIVIEGEPWRPFYVPFLGKKGKKEAEALQLVEQVKSYFEEKEAKGAMNYLLFLLKLKGYTEYELTSKLNARAVPLLLQKQLIKKLKNWGYLNDNEEIRRFIERESLRGFGPFIVQAKVAKRCQLSFAEIESLVKEVFPCSQALLVIEKLFRKRSFKSKQHLVQFFIRRGYPIDWIETALQRGGDLEETFFF